MAEQDSSRGVAALNEEESCLYILVHEVVVYVLVNMITGKQVVLHAMRHSGQDWIWYGQTEKHMDGSNARGYRDAGMPM